MWHRQLLPGTLPVFALLKRERNLTKKHFEILNMLPELAKFDAVKSEEEEEEEKEKMRAAKKAAS